MTMFMQIVIPIFISLLGYAAVLTFKHIEYRADLKRLDKELLSARTELASFNEKKEQEISDIIKSNKTRIEELTKTINELQSKNEKSTHDNSLNEDWLAALIEKILELNKRIETLENPNQYLHGLDALNEELKKVIDHTNKT